MARNRYGDQLHPPAISWYERAAGTPPTPPLGFRLIRDQEAWAHHYVSVGRREYQPGRMLSSHGQGSEACKHMYTVLQSVLLYLKPIATLPWIYREGADTASVLSDEGGTPLAKVSVT